MWDYTVLYLFLIFRSKYSTEILSFSPSLPIIHSECAHTQNAVGKTITVRCGFNAMVLCAPRRNFLTKIVKQQQPTPTRAASCAVLFLIKSFLRVIETKGMKKQKNTKHTIFRHPVDLLKTQYIRKRLKCLNTQNQIRVVHIFSLFTHDTDKYNENGTTSN